MKEENKKIIVKRWTEKARDDELNIRSISSASGWSAERRMFFVPANGGEIFEGSVNIF